MMFKYTKKDFDLSSFHYQDTYQNKGARRKLVKLLETKGIDSKILVAIGKVPRHAFFSSDLQIHAYDNKAFPIEENQTISQPYTVAFQTQLLHIKPQDKILEIGTGSGYQTCVLASMNAEVFTIEYHKKLYEKARVLLPFLGYQAHFFHGDGSVGLLQHQYYDSIIVTAGATQVPDPLLQQLKIGGRLVIPVGEAKNQKMLQIVKNGCTTYTTHTYDNFRFVPLLGENGCYK